MGELFHSGLPKNSNRNHISASFWVRPSAFWCLLLRKCNTIEKSKRVRFRPATPFTFSLLPPFSQPCMVHFLSLSEWGLGGCDSARSTGVYRGSRDAESFVKRCVKGNCRLEHRLQTTIRNLTPANSYTTTRDDTRCLCFRGGDICPPCHHYA